MDPMRRSNEEGRRYRSVYGVVAAGFEELVAMETTAKEMQAQVAQLKAGYEQIRVDDEALRDRLERLASAPYP